MRRLLGFSLSICLTLSLLGLVEICLRVWFRQEGLRSRKEERFIQENRLFWMDIFQTARVSVTKRDRDLLWTNRPNTAMDLQIFSLRPQNQEKSYYPTAHFITNGQGLVGIAQDVPVAKPSGELRILSIGDSSAAGWGLVDPRQAYAAVLEEMLNQEKPLPHKSAYRVLNAGVIGYTSTQGLRYLERQGLEFDPDIIVTYFGNNDGSLHGKKSDAEIFAAVDRAAVRLAVASTLRDSLDHSYVVRFLTERRRQRSYSRDISQDSRVVRVTPDQYAKNLQDMARWSKASRKQLIFVMPPTNYLWPTRFFQVDERTASAAQKNGSATLDYRAYPGKGVPLRCRHEADCLVSLYGLWLVTNLNPQAVKEQRAERGGVSLWQARHEELTGQIAVAETMLNQWLAAAEAVEPAQEAIARNNLAMLLARNPGSEDQVEKLLRQARALDPRNPYLAFNLGSFLLDAGRNLQEIRALLEEHIRGELDMVRLHEPYRQALHQVAVAEGIAVVDLDQVVWAKLLESRNPDFFIDSCHPSPTGHRRIAENILATIEAEKAVYSQVSRTSRPAVR